jgi:DNA-binding MarR family transcriptional regulator
MQPDATISYLIARLGRAHRARAGALLATVGLHPGQEMVLLRLVAEPGLSQNELADRLGIEPPTLTRGLQRLERAGLVERRPDADDARLVRVHLTPAGTACLAPIQVAWAELEAITTAGLTADELEQARSLLRRLIDNVAIDDSPYDNRC